MQSRRPESTETERFSRSFKLLLGVTVQMYHNNKIKLAVYLRDLWLCKGSCIRCDSLCKVRPPRGSTRTGSHAHAASGCWPANTCTILLNFLLLDGRQHSHAWQLGKACCSKYTCTNLFSTFLRSQTCKGCSEFGLDQQ